MSGSVDELAETPVSDLAMVRRPPSYRGMRNSVHRLVVPGPTGNVGVWAESRNELTQLRNLLFELRVTTMMTQPVRLEFILDQGIASHVPDCLVETDDGERHLFDFTRDLPHDDTERAAPFRLTAVVARHLGWTYVVRSEASIQRQRNIDFLWAHRGANRAATDPDAEVRVLVQRLPLPIHVVYRRWSTGGPGATTRIWEAIANQHMFVDLEQPLGPESLVHAAPPHRAREWEWTP